jgi:hypothetical protein
MKLIEQAESTTQKSEKSRPVVREEEKPAKCGKCGASGGAIGYCGI